MHVGIAYMVAHLLAEKHMLTSDLKLGHRPGSQDILTAKLSFTFGINIS